MSLHCKTFFLSLQQKVKAMFARIKRMIERRRNRKRDFAVLKGSVIVSDEEMNSLRKIKVPVRCLDGTVVMSEKEIPVPVCKAIESLSYRLLADYERFVDVSYQPRRKEKKVKVNALLGVMCNLDKTRDNG